MARRMGRGGLTGFMLDNTSRGRQEWFESGGVSMCLPVAGFRLAARAGVGLAVIIGHLEHGRLRVEVRSVTDESATLAFLLEAVRRRPEDWVFWDKAGAVVQAERSRCPVVAGEQGPERAFEAT